MTSKPDLVERLREHAQQLSNPKATMDLQDELDLINDLDEAIAALSTPLSEEIAYWVYCIRKGNNTEELADLIERLARENENLCRQNEKIERAYEDGQQRIKEMKDE